MRLTCVYSLGVHNYSPSDLDEAIAFIAQTFQEYPFAELVSPPMPLSKMDAAIELAKSAQYYRVALAPMLVARF
jgi:hypothetical protein